MSSTGTLAPPGGRSGAAVGPSLGTLVPVIVLGALWMTLVAAPLAWMALQIGDRSHAQAVFHRVGASLLMNSLLWHAMASTVAVLLAWLPAIVLTRREGATALRRMLLIATVMTALLAPWMLFASWWTMLAPGNAVHDWFAAQGHGTSLRRTTLLLGLVGWGWAPATLVIAWWRRSADPSERVLDRLDGVRRWGRLRAAWRRDAGGIAIAWLLLMLAFGGDTVCFDLAQERSMGFELRSLEAQGADPGTIVRIGAPMVLVTIVLLGCLVALVARRARRGRRSVHERDPMPSGDAVVRAGAAAVIALVVSGVIGPLLGLAWKLGQSPEAWDFVALHGRGAMNALGITLVMAMVGAALAALHAVVASSHGRGGAARSSRMRGTRSRVLLCVEAILIVGWLTPATMPAAIQSAAVAGLWESCVLTRPMVDSPLIIVAALTGRLGAVAVIVGAIGGRVWAVAHSELEQLDGGAARLSTLLTARRPMLIATVLAGATVLASLSAGEIAVAARVEPPGFDWLASSVLAAIHYQRPGAVSLAIVGAVIVALGAALVLIAVGRRLAHAGSLTGISVSALFVVASIGVAGCAKSDAEETRPLPVSSLIGGPGLADGTFERPRAVAVDRARNEIVVVDKTARVQRFGADGSLRSIFRMPEWELGQPVGVTVDEAGTIYVPDTHYHRVIVYDRDGREVRRFGRYGFGDGEFIYPTDVAVASDGTLFVSDYGGTDRIQVFDAEGRFIRAFGGPGRQPGEFERPQSMAFSRDGTELFIADCCNHRIQVVDPRRGEVVRVIGAIGRDRGELAYPWAIEVLDDGSLLVVEWGNDRVQRLDAESGACLGAYGGRGRERGRLWQPWAIAVDGTNIFVVDTGNNRVQVVSLAELGLRRSARAAPR